MARHGKYVQLAHELSHQPFFTNKHECTILSYRTYLSLPSKLAEQFAAGSGNNLLLTE